MWTEPKTDWVISDYFNKEDYNRIKNNIAFLRDLAVTIYDTFSIEDMGSDKTSYSEFPYADEFNHLENNLQTIRDKTFNFYQGSKKTWYENQRFPNYEDFNRLEKACLLIYEGLEGQRKNLRRLAFTLGTKQSAIKV